MQPGHPTVPVWRGRAHTVTSLHQHGSQPKRCSCKYGVLTVLHRPACLGAGPMGAPQPCVTTTTGSPFCEERSRHMREGPALGRADYRFCGTVQYCAWTESRVRVGAAGTFYSTLRVLLTALIERGGGARKASVCTPTCARHVRPFSREPTPSG